MRPCLKIIRIILLLLLLMMVVMMMMKLNKILTSIFLFTAQFPCHMWIVAFIFHIVQIEVIVIIVESSVGYHYAGSPAVAWSHAWRGQKAMVRFCKL